MDRTKHAPPVGRSRSLTRSAAGLLSVVLLSGTAFAACSGAHDPSGGAAPGATTAAGDVITYSYLVTNVGATALPGLITVTDDRAVVTCPSGSLAAYATISCGATYVITSADVTAGSVTNTATAQSGSTISLPVSATVTRVP